MSQEGQKPRREPSFGPPGNRCRFTGKLPTGTCRNLQGKGGDAGGSATLQPPRHIECVLDLKAAKGASVIEVPTQMLLRGRGDRMDRRAGGGLSTPR
jgi:hypothetical protein